MNPLKIGIVSLGCSRNLVDSERILGRLAKKGHEVVEVGKADIGVVNTCAFIDEATKESIDSILDLINLKKEGRLKKVIVSGCLVQRYADELRSNLKEVDAFIGRQEIDNDNLNRYPLAPGHFAYLKISEGCSHSCSFCAIPKIKGPLKSRSMDSILKEVRRLDREGKAEINIIGQDTSLYGLDLYKRPRLTALLKNITAELKNIRWVRLLYLHPDYLDPELVELMAREPRLCKYIDLPIQHINNRILKAMNRRTPGDKIMRMLEYLRRKIPGVCIRTTLIVGFPGESDREFKELLSFVNKERFGRLGVFKYSPQEDTAAFNFKKQIPEKIKRQRLNIIMRAQQKISKEFNTGFLGKELEVLIEEKGSDGTFLGRLAIDAPEVDGLVYISSTESIRPGEFKKVMITGAYEYDLVGEIIAK